MQDFEKLGVFYLGREYDLEKKALKENLVLYDSRDLVTHAVCVGMTGSGKTGLCIGLLEEAAIDNIPAIVVDPKGDLANLLLTFPDLADGDFLPWINEEDARRKGVSPQEFAARQAALWKKGLADWGQDGARVRKLRDSAEFSIYTPGSTAGLPVSILKSFAFPGKAVTGDSELLGERIGTTVTSILNLLGVEADPIQSREHILLSTILDASWKDGRDLDLAGFIQAIQSPPVARIGVFDLESFFPSKDRFALAMKINNLLAAPGFSAWLEGDPLSIDRMFHTAEGKPRVSIFSVAHLNDAERMFFVSLLLTQLLGWMRSQSGTTSLRALFYMDEIFGYFPPVANPPSKLPLLTLLKQARAFGLGIVLATQNPVDLDYKGLSNTGTWFLGRLQTDRDKERVLDGLEGAAAGGAGRFDRKRMEQILAGLGERVFLMNNVHEDAPVIFQTRWAMSYLRGPLTRAQIRKLMDAEKAKRPGPVPAGPAAASTAPPAARERASASAQARPSLPPEVPQFFLPVRGAEPEGASLHYEPMLLGIGKVYFANAKIGVAAQKDVCLMTEFPDGPSRVDWDGAREAEIGESDLEKFPHDPGASFGELPREASNAKSYAGWGIAFKEWVYRNGKLDLWKSPSSGILSGPGEPEREFRLRLQQAGREKRDGQVDRLRQKYTPKIAALQDRIRRAEQSVEREKAQATQQKISTAISFGATLLTALTGRKVVSQSSLGRAATAARGAGRTLKESQDVARAAESVQALQKQLDDLQALLDQEIEEVKTGADPLAENLETCEVRPKKTDVSVALVSLAWFPYWRDGKGGIAPAR
ncbi:MAG: ATP-binding protein [Deltaproteobacteria bacterium]|nr:ATP-binding protein [Deltaproteobacteria bacterium]